MTTRTICRHAAFTLLLALLSMPATESFAQYPTKPIRMVVALAAGGPTDVVARIVAQKLTEQLGQQIVVDNRPGAGGSVAGEMVARAPADGYTLFFAANGTYAIAPNFMKLPYDVKKDLAPVALIGVSPLALMVHPSVPAKAVKDLIALARTKPGAIHYGSAGQGSTGHLSAELFGMMAGVKLTHVPYRGAAPAAIALIAGETEMLISGVSASHPHIKAGRVRALAVTSARRVQLLPQVPAIAESVPGYDVSSWFALTTVAGTPPAVIARLNQETVKAVGSTEVRGKLLGAGVEPEPGTPEQLAAKLRSETEKWGKVVRAAGMKVQ
jgi:tripartite-type tricarboxylate transporter receptor subunit TctC